jgi:hypothetical protein
MSLRPFRRVFVRIRKPQPTSPCSSTRAELFRASTQAEMFAMQDNIGLTCDQDGQW